MYTKSRKLRRYKNVGGTVGIKITAPNDNLPLHGSLWTYFGIHYNPNILLQSNHFSLSHSQYIQDELTESTWWCRRWRRLWLKEHSRIQKYRLPSYKPSSLNHLYWSWVYDSFQLLSGNKNESCPIYNRPHLIPKRI